MPSKITIKDTGCSCTKNRETSWFAFLDQVEVSDQITELDR